MADSSSESNFERRRFKFTYINYLHLFIQNFSTKTTKFINANLERLHFYQGSTQGDSTWALFTIFFGLY